MTTTDAEKVAAFDALAALDPYLFMENATYFACVEADAIFIFVKAAHGQEMADSFLAEHRVSGPHQHTAVGVWGNTVIDKEIR